MKWTPSQCAFTTFILATFWLKLNVEEFKHSGVVVWDTLPWVDRSIVVSFRSPWLQQQAFVMLKEEELCKLKKFDNDENKLSSSPSCC
jgi:hypothetical protein